MVKITFTFPEDGSYIQDIVWEVHILHRQLHDVALEGVLPLLMSTNRQTRTFSIHPSRYLFHLVVNGSRTSDEIDGFTTVAQCVSYHRDRVSRSNISNSASSALYNPPYPSMLLSPNTSTVEADNETSVLLREQSHIIADANNKIGGRNSSKVDQSLSPPNRKLVNNNTNNNSNNNETDNNNDTDLKDLLQSPSILVGEDEDTMATCSTHETSASNNGFIKAVSLTIEIEFNCSSQLIKEEHEYMEYIHRLTPVDGAIDVPLDVHPQLLFKVNEFNGQTLNLNAMINKENSPVLSAYGDMENILGSKFIAMRKGFIKWNEGFEIEQQLLLLEIDTKKFNSEYLVRRYHWENVNAGYVLGDKHSWQRYTDKQPIECKYVLERIVIPGKTAEVSSTVSDSLIPINVILGGGGGGGLEEENNSLGEGLSSITMVPYSYLQPNTCYGILLVNGTPIVPANHHRASIKSFSAPGYICEDRLFIFKTGDRK